MSTRLLIVFLSVAVGTLCGYIVFLSYKRNYTYLGGVCDMLSALKQNLAYKKDTVPVVLSGMTISNALLKKNIDEYIAYTAGQSDKREVSRGFLPQSTFDGVNDLFAAIGGSDENSQSARLDALELRFDKLLADAERKYTKYGSVAVKLGFLVGLGVGVLVL
ncbi:MAG: hypothetical protein K2O04_05300 [Clostridiales bacterium]|nr:hypothetical protein [Clostridiales bacterium]